MESALKDVLTLTDAKKGLEEQLAKKTSECDVATTKIAELTAESKAHQMTEGKLKEQHTDTLNKHEVANAGRWSRALNTNISH